MVDWIKVAICAGAITLGTGIGYAAGHSTGYDAGSEIKKKELRKVYEQGTMNGRHQGRIVLEQMLQDVNGIESKYKNSLQDSPYGLRDAGEDYGE